MVDVKLLVCRSGIDGAFNVGDTITVSPAEAQRMVDAGQAVLVRQVAPEKATSKRSYEKASK